MPYRTTRQVYVPGVGMETHPDVHYVVPRPPAHQPTPTWHILWQLMECTNPVTSAVLLEILEHRNERGER